MTANVGLIDRVLRLLVGVGLLAFFFLGEGGARWKRPGGNGRSCWPMFRLTMKTGRHLKI